MEDVPDVRSPIESALVAFRDSLREERTAEEIAAGLTRAIETALAPAFVELQLERGIGAAPPIAADDPLVGYALRQGGLLPAGEAAITSPALTEARARGADAVVPLVSQGMLAGLIVLGAREGGYGEGERRYLEDLAALGAAALRVAWLTHQYQAAERIWESNAEELRIAQAIQRSLLPKQVPEFAGWRIATHYQPARVVGGDLYDFIPLPGDLLGIVFGDASDKGVPAALMMATARTLLRASAQRLVLPARVLQQVNEALAAQLPPGTFVTCFFAILDPASGRLRFANAGQTPPYLRGAAGATELRASGWPLGMMPETTYEEEEVTLAPGETVLFTSDGWIETHAPDGAMFGGAHLREILVGLDAGVGLIEAVRTEHTRFAGPDWDQEDDLTLVTLARLPEAERVLCEFDLPSVDGNEIEAMRRVEVAVEGLGLPARRLERLKTAVAETVMNATEHGNGNRAELPVRVRVLLAGDDLKVRVSDRGSGLDDTEIETPDLEAKLAGMQSPHGWGIFLTEQMVDAVSRSATTDGYVVELVVHLTNEPDAGESPSELRQLA